MAKGRKKKKDVDFQKIKLKVGRKLKRDTNETKAEFKAKKIIIREAKLNKTDPLSMLMKNNETMSQNSKVILLNQLTSVLSGELVKSLNKPIMDAIAKFLIDHSEQVRGACGRCVKTCFNHMRQLHLPIRDFLESLRPYLNCAYTHISSPIQTDCRTLLSHFIISNDSSIYDILMSIILRRLEAGNLSLKDYKLAQLLGQCVRKHKEKIAFDESLGIDRIQPLQWSEENFYLNLHELIQNDYKNSVNLVDDEIIIAPRQERCDNIEGRYFQILDSHPNLEEYESET